VYGLATVSGSAYRLYSSSLTNVTAGEYLRYEDSTTGEFKVIRAKAAMAKLSETFDPIEWWFPEDTPIQNGDARYGRTLIYVRARATPSFSWGNSDKTFNNTLTGDSSTMPGTSSTTYYVHEKITWAGKFPSFAGGNRPPFISGGSRLDRIRNFTGTIGQWKYIHYTKVFQLKVEGSGGQANSNNGGNDKSSEIEFNPSFVVPTGPEVSPRTFSVVLWRRVS
jgi:hypothetical protein